MNGGNPETIPAAEVVVFRQEETGLAVSGLAVTDDLVAMAEKRMRNFQRLLSVAISATTEHDWVDQGGTPDKPGKPYLCASGAEKIGRPFGVKWSNLKLERMWAEDDRGRYYIYVCTALFELPSGLDSIVSVGTCSQRDTFFSTKTDWTGGVKTTILKTTSDIDETNIMKSAVSNCIQNGITRLLGLRGLTWEQVEAAGLKREKAAKVGYTGKEAPADDKATANRKKILDMILEMVHGEADKAGPLLQEITAWETKATEDKPSRKMKGQDHPDKIPDNGTFPALKKVEAAYQEWKKNHPAPPSNGAGFQGTPTETDDQKAFL